MAGRRLATLFPALLAVSLLGGVVPGAPKILVSASSVCDAFSPDHDGYRDSAKVSYKVHSTSRTWVRVYGDRGLVRTLRAGRVRAGSYSAAWDGCDDGGAEVAPGTYHWVVTARRTGVSTNVSGRWRLTRAASDRWVGFHVPGVPLRLAPLAELEARVGEKAKVVNYFQDTSQGFTRPQAANAADSGHVPMITLEFWDPAAGVDQPACRLDAIAGGSWDAYLRQYARDAKSFGRTVMLRPLHEMNGDWYPWAGTVNGNEPADFVAAWRRVRTIFREEGASNVLFVWCPNCDSMPDTAANSIARYWPGDGYVDLVAIDGYNFGTGSSRSTWRSFGDVFGEAYSAVTPLSSKLVFIAETACSPSGGDKAAWIADMFRVIPQRFPRIQGVVWFNADKERDWRLESDSTSLEAFRAGLAGF